MVEKAGLIQSYQDFIIKLLLTKRSVLDMSKNIFIILVHQLVQASEKKTKMLNTLRVTLWLVN